MKMADHFASRGYSLKKQTRWSNDKRIIELGYCKISWFVSVSQINYLPQPSASANNSSAYHRQITIFCLTSSNNCWLFVVSNIINHHIYCTQPIWADTWAILASWDNIILWEHTWVDTAKYCLQRRSSSCFPLWLYSPYGCLNFYRPFKWDHSAH